MGVSDAEDYDEYRDVSSEEDDYVYFNEPLPLGAAHCSGVAQGATTTYEKYKARVTEELGMDEEPK